MADMASAALILAIALGFTPGPDLAPTELSNLLWERAPALAADRAVLGAARADVERSHLLPNPTLDAAWSTIPIGQTTPPNYADRMSRIPNYSLGVSELIEIGKRGPRQRAAAASLGEAAYNVYADLADHYFEVLTRLGQIASSQIRSNDLAELVKGAEQLTQLQRARVSKGDSPALDAERAALEEAKLRSAYEEEVAQLAQALRDCTTLLGDTCHPFPSLDAAAQFLELRPPQDGLAVTERPDIKAVENRQTAAAAERDLAGNKVIPDPTVRVGYVYDQFVVSGNQRNSLFVGVSIPLPFLDRGQTDKLEADTKQWSAVETRERLQAQAETRALKIGEARDVAVLRRTRMREKTLPMARDIVRDLDLVIQRGGASLQDLLMARRTLNELLVDAAELDRRVFELEVELARVRGWAPPPPAALRQALNS